MTLSNAIKGKDLEGLKTAMANAMGIYKAGEPTDYTIDTVYGEISLASGLLDEATLWELAMGELVGILTKASSIPDNADKRVEVAKLITSNAVLRGMVSEIEPVEGDLL